jgi:hypothetical protein
MTVTDCTRRIVIVTALDRDEHDIEDMIDDLPEDLQDIVRDMVAEIPSMSFDVRLAVLNIAEYAALYVQDRDYGTAEKFLALCGDILHPLVVGEGRAAEAAE